MQELGWRILFIFNQNDKENMIRWVEVMQLRFYFFLIMQNGDKMDLVFIQLVSITACHKLN